VSAPPEPAPGPDDAPSRDPIQPTRDERTDSEHDCDRILYSDELRRLGGVTQVVAVGEMPLFHTRLTHTLKVQQLSRRMAEHLCRNDENRAVIERLGGLDPSAAEAAGLAHDLGHPPFGHVGDSALNRHCRKNHLDGYEGNAQTFRILTKLARRGADNAFGLELSDRTLRAVVKYPWRRTGQHESDSKWNAYPTEGEIFERIRGGLAGGEARSPEAAIMDWADDITYAVHDLEDFIRSGRVPMVALAGDDVERAEFTSRAVDRLKDKSKLAEVDWPDVVAIFELLVTTFFAQFRRHSGTSEDVAKLRSVSRGLIDNFVSPISLEIGPEPLIVPPDTRGVVELFKQLTWHYVIHDPALATLQEGHVLVLDALFEKLLDWLKDAEAKKTMFRLPQRLVDLHKLTAAEPGHEYYPNPDARRARAVADYIASLTEIQAIDLHERLFGAGGHSVSDPWLNY